MGRSGKTVITVRLSTPDEHLHRCLVYVDLNMVRAGVVSHPENGRTAVTVRLRSR
jgi:hypothetical protein